MLPQRRPTISTPPARERETFTWPPSTEELDALEVIVLEDAPPTRRPRRRKVDVAHWGLTLASLTAIVVALALQFVSWRGTDRQPQAAPVATAAPIAAAAPVAPVSTAAGVVALTRPIVEQAASVRLTAPPPTDRTVMRPAAFVPARKARPSNHRLGEPQPRTSIDSPPLRLPESYVQPRLVSSGDRNRVRGEVVLGVQVHANGRVGAVDVLSDGDKDSARDLERAAVAAVKQWRYRPALRDGVPTPARLKVIVKFS